MLLQNKYEYETETFELSKMYGFSQKNFFRKVRGTNIHLKS